MARRAASPSSLLFAITLCALTPLVLSSACPEVLSRQYILSGQETVDDELLKISAVISDRTGTCSATVLNERYILTAAHCDFEPGAGVRVAVTNSLVPATARVERFIKHPSYTNETILHDIAVVEIAPPLVAPTVVRLHTGAQIKPGVYVRAAGYGVDTADFKTVINNGMGTFRRVDLPIVPVDDCRMSLVNNNIRLPPEFTGVNYICAGFVDPGHCGGDTCVGDSGGPIVVKSAIDGNYVQVGLTSAGSGCGEDNIPGIYTNIESHVTWVAKAVEGSITTTDAFFTPKPAPEPPAPAPAPPPLPSSTSSSTTAPASLPSPPVSLAPASPSPTSKPTAPSAPPSLASPASSTSPSGAPPPSSASGAPDAATNSAKPQTPASPQTTVKPTDQGPGSGSGGGGDGVTVEPAPDPGAAGPPNGNDQASNGGAPSPDKNGAANTTAERSATARASRRRLSQGAVGAIAGVFSILGLALIAGGVFLAMRGTRASRAVGDAPPEANAAPEVAAAPEGAGDASAAAENV